VLIGEVSARSGISARMLRHYDSVGLVSPSGRTPGGYRRYEDEDLRRLFHVEGLRALGLTLQQVASVLADTSFEASDLVDGLLARTRERLARDQQLLDRLEQVRASGPVAWSEVLRTIELLHGLGASSPSVRQRAVISRTEPGGRDAVPLARAVLDETDPHVAGALHWALTRAGDDTVPVLVEALDSAHRARRRRALAALVEVGSPAALAAVTAALRHPDRVVSGRAALVCGARGDLAAVPRLLALVVDGCDDVEAAEVLGSLAAQHDCADTITTGITRALEAADPAVRRRLTAALAEVPGAAATAALHRLTSDPDPAVALTATTVLRQRAP
jgi:DNA-binding transcriptional MerR regulator